MIWFLEGQSSQREVIMGARDALPASVQIVASHRQLRSEITGQADVALQEPTDNDERIDWVIFFLMIRRPPRSTPCIVGSVRCIGDSCSRNRERRCQRETCFRKRKQKCPR